jgi:hypothetical protein
MVLYAPLTSKCLKCLVLQRVPAREKCVLGTGSSYSRESRRARSRVPETAPVSFKSRCQNRTTLQPFSFRTSLTRRSRALFLSIFFSQNSAFVFGIFSSGWPCQNSPSTKTATRLFGNTKSGFPNSGYPRRHPVMLFERNIRIIANSVRVLPLLRIFDIISERLRCEKQSMPLRKIKAIVISDRLVIELLRFPKNRRASFRLPRAVSPK